MIFMALAVSKVSYKLNEFKAYETDELLPVISVLYYKWLIFLTFIYVHHMAFCDVNSLQFICSTTIPTKNKQKGKGYLLASFLSVFILIIWW